MPKLNKTIKYTPELAFEFFELCSKGWSLVQIAAHQGILKKHYFLWSKHEIRKPDFHTAWVRGKEACQAYHESLLDKMIRQEIKASSAEIEAQKYRLRV